jgi:hypothetical protein
LNKLSGASKTAPRVAGIVIKTERNVNIKYFVILLPFGKNGVLKERYRSKQREKFRNSTIFWKKSNRIMIEYVKILIALAIVNVGLTDSQRVIVL